MHWEHAHERDGHVRERVALRMDEDGAEQRGGVRNDLNGGGNNDDPVDKGSGLGVPRQRKVFGWCGGICIERQVGDVVGKVVVKVASVNDSCQVISRCIDQLTRDA